MKIARVIQIFLFVYAFAVLGDLIYGSLFKSGGGSSVGFGYGNLWIRYSVAERGVLTPAVQWLIATPEMPIDQMYRGEDDQWSFTFANGKSFEFQADSEHLVWIDPMTGPDKISADLTGELIGRMERTQGQAKGQTFEDGATFLAWLDPNKAQQGASPNRLTRSESKTQGD